MVDQGIIAGCAGGGFENICAAADILKGNKKVKDFPVEGADKSKLYINKAEMETLGITIPQSVLDRAEMM